MHEDRFGFLSEELDVDFDGGSIATLPGFANIFESYEQQSDPHALRPCARA